MILVTGATGFIGSALLNELCSMPFMVRATSRRPPSSKTNFEHHIVEHIDHKTNWSQALEGVEVVIHTAARVHVMNDRSTDPLSEFRKVNLIGTLNLAKQAAEKGVKRFIFLSSIKVNGELTVPGNPFKSDDSPHPVDPYGVSKAEAEKALLELGEITGMEVVIIRPPLVYGAGVKANFKLIMKWVRSQIPFPFKPEINRRSLVFLGNLVNLLITCINHPNAPNNIFLVSDDDDISTAELIRRIAKSMNVRCLMLPVPTAMIELGASTIGKKAVAQRLFGNLQVDIENTKNKLNWKPPFSVNQGLEQTINNFNLID